MSNTIHKSTWLWAALVLGLLAVGFFSCQAREEAGRRGGGVTGGAADAATATYVPPGDLDKYYLFYSGGHSGNVYVVFNPGWFINDLDGLSVVVVHGSPWRHDIYVPIIFAGYGTKSQKVSRRVHTCRGRDTTGHRCRNATTLWSGWRFVAGGAGAVALSVAKKIIGQPKEPPATHRQPHQRVVAFRQRWPVLTRHLQCEPGAKPSAAWFHIRRR